MQTRPTVCNCGLFQLILDVINHFIQWYINFPVVVLLCNCGFGTLVKFSSVCVFLVFICAVLGFWDPLYTPFFILYQSNWRFNIPSLGIPQEFDAFVIPGGGEFDSYTYGWGIWTLTLISWYVSWCLLTCDHALSPIYNGHGERGHDTVSYRIAHQETRICFFTDWLRNNTY